MRKRLNIIFCGELDSGKSSVIGRMLFDTASVSEDVLGKVSDPSVFNFAYFLDSFQEEKDGDFTLDTTQAFLKSAGREYVFIDVPGHKELLKNMLTGASFADKAVVLVDAQKGADREQTRRHILILNFLGITRPVIAVNKMDLCGYKRCVFERHCRDMEKMLTQMDIRPGYFIPVSAQYGDNLCRASKKMPWYRGRPLLGSLAGMPEREAVGPFRFPVQDVYRIGGKIVAAGSVLSGRIRKSEKVVVLPQAKQCIVKSIMVFDSKKPSASAHQSIGMVLDPGEGLKRGQVICKPRLPFAAKEITARIFCTKPLDTRRKFVFKCLTQAVKARITKVLDTRDSDDFATRRRGAVLKENDFALVVMRADSLVAADKFTLSAGMGRFILQGADKEINALGVVV